MKKLISILVTACLCITAALSSMGCTGGKPTLYLYNYANYMDEDIIAEFEKANNCKVKISYYEAPEEMYTKYVNSGESYDVVVTSDYMISRMINENLLAKLDYQNIPNGKNTDQKYLDSCATFDPGNQYAVPYMWGTLGILYDSNKVSADKVKSWNVLWDETFKNSVCMIDSARDAFAIALLRLGKSVNTTDDATIQQAYNILLEQKKTTVRSYTVDQVKVDLSEGLAPLGVVYSGDAIMAMDEHDNMAYSLPQEGTNVWYDCCVVPSNAAHKELAEKFINFLCDGDIAFRNVNTTGYCTPNSLAYAKLSDSVKNNTDIYPSEEYMKKCEVYVDWGDKADQYEDLFTTIKNS